MPTKHTTIRLTSELKKALAEQAARERRSSSNLLTVLIEEGLARRNKKSVFQ